MELQISKTESILDIEDYVLDEFVPLKKRVPALQIVFTDDLLEYDGKHGQLKCPMLKFPFAKSPLKQLLIKQTSQLLKTTDNNTSSGKTILEIVFDSKEFLEYEWLPGDTIGILPSNSVNSVNQMLYLLNLECKADNKCYIESTNLKELKRKLPAHIPPITTPREILQDCLNLTGILKKEFLNALSEWTNSTKEKRFLSCLASKAGSEYYNEIILKRRYNLFDILEMCSTCKPPLDLLVEYLPRLLPRDYSIATSPLERNEEFAIIVNVLHPETGVTSSMLQTASEKLDANEGPVNILAYLKEPNRFRYTSDDLHLNQILIAIGTGLAPFLGFLQHKYHLMQQQRNGKDVSTLRQTWLIVGATNEASVLHRNDLLSWKSLGVLQKFVECHSRTTKSTYHYVQQAIQHLASDFVQMLLDDSTTLYVCADGSQISKSIKESICQCLETQLEINNSAATQMINDFINNGKYREDIWV